MTAAHACPTRRALSLRLLLALLVAGCAAHRADSRAPAETAAAVRAVLSRQLADWNRGDVRAFMQGYERGPDVVFTSGGRVQRGYDATLQRYLASYPDRRAMGTLRFDALEVVPLGEGGALAWGRWRLVRADGELGGVFSLALRRGPDGWRIVHDHTSSDPPTAAATDGGALGDP